MFQRIAASGAKTVVQLEPDFWGYIANQNIAATGAVNIAAHAPECAGITQDVRGFGQCLIKMARTIAPKAYIGFHFSVWGSPDERTLHHVQGRRLRPDQDFITYDIIDRDVGCYEAHTQSGLPGRLSTTTSTYWDETNTTSPNFHDNEKLLGQITTGLNLPLILWQVPFGDAEARRRAAPPGHYRDNRVHYIFSHVAEYAGIGVAGAVFGVGAQNQTYLTTDNGQFKNATTAYFASPVALPRPETGRGASLAFAGSPSALNSAAHAAALLSPRTAERLRRFVSTQSVGTGGGLRGRMAPLRR